MIHRLGMAMVTFLSFMAGLGWLWIALNIQSPPKIWAMTSATVFSIVFMGLSHCAYRHQCLRDRIEECASAKERLEKMILKKRLSSKG